MGSQQGQAAISVGAQGMMSEIKRPERGIDGNTYLDEIWMPGKIDFISGQVLENKPMRYDILMDQVEVNLDGVLRGVSGKNVKSFSLFNKEKMSYDVFVNGNQYQLAGTKLTGFFKVISSGEWSLLEKTEVVYIKPTYNAALDVGAQEGKYVKKSKFYMAQETSVFLVAKNKKEFLKSFNEKSEDVAAFIKQEDLSIKRTEDLERIADFLNK